MKRNVWVGLALLVMVAYGAYIFILAPIAGERNAVRNIEFQDIDLSLVADGDYRGEFGYGSNMYEVEVKVIDHKIVAIEVVKNRDSEHAKKAEGVIERVIDAQSVQVDVVTGATTTSKAILKAIENALLSAGEPFITGIIFDVEERILVVAGIETADMEYNEWFEKGNRAIWLAVTDAVIVDKDGERKTAQALKRGQRVQAWVSDPVMESYPEQGSADKVVILD